MILKSGELVGQLFLFSHLQTICKQALLSNTCSALSPMHFARVCLSLALKAIMLVYVNNDASAYKRINAHMVKIHTVTGYRVNVVLFRYAFL